MKHLKVLQIIINLLFIFITFNSCYSQKEESKVPANLQITAALGGSGKFLDTVNVIYISTTLYNPTKDTIRFVTMTCSYEDLFTTNTNVFHIQSRYDCYSNYPTVIELPPNMRTDKYIMISRMPKMIDTSINTFKVGMYFLEYQRGETFGDIVKQYEQREKGKVIWSNELDLSRFTMKYY